MNQLFVQKSVTGTDVFDSSIWIEPPIVRCTINIGKSFAHILRVNADM